VLVRLGESWSIRVNVRFITVVCGISLTVSVIWFWFSQDIKGLSRGIYVGYFK
jgi:hypothetical protein